MRHSQRFLSALIALTLFILIRAQGASWWALGLCGAAALWTHLSKHATRFERFAHPRIRSAAVLALLLVALLRAYQTRELITPGVDLLLLLSAERSFFRHRLREQIQLLLLCTILMAIAGVVHVGMDYPLLLALFILLSLGHLGFWNLQRQAEKIGSRARFALRTQGSRMYRSILAQNLRFGLGVLSCALLVFLFFPRIGAGVFLRGERLKSAQAGFSDEISLGHRGNISNNPKVVARIFPDRPPESDSLPLYFRVSSLDAYRAGRWSHSSKALTSRLLRSSHRYYPMSPLPPFRAASYLRRKSTGQHHFAPIKGWSRSEQLFSLRFVQEDLGTQHLILPSRTGIVEWLPRGALEKRARLQGGQDGQVKARGPLAGSMQFRTFARSNSPSSSDLEAVGSPRYGPELTAYLSVPTPLNPTLRDFAQEATAHLQPKQRSQYQVVKALEEALRKFRYSTQSAFDPEQLSGVDPIEYFLKNSQEGHCEYFASALALLVRSEGFPARVVNGYYGAHKNPVDGTYQIAQSQAHSWVEVYFANLGWMVFDATPSAERPQSPLEGSILTTMRSLYQALETKYLEYIVDYDGKKQWSAFKSLGQASQRIPSKRSTIMAVGVLLCFVLLFWWRKKPHALDSSQRIRQAQERVATTLRDRGFKIEAQENPLSWARRASDGDYDPAGTLLDAITRSEGLRFGAKEPTATEIRAILAALSQQERALRALKIGASSPSEQEAHKGQDAKREPTRRTS